jgi:hypothetical protein
VFHQWLARHALEIKTGAHSTHAAILRTFGKDVLPFLGKRPILDLRRPGLLEVIERIGALLVSEHVRGHLIPQRADRARHPGDFFHRVQ